MKLRDMNPEFTPWVVQGVAALRAGQRARARRLLARALREDPANATAWFWLSRCTADEEQRQECLRRVMRLDRARGAAELEGKVQAAPAGALSPPQRRSQPRRRWSRRRRIALAAVAAAAVILTCVLAPTLRWSTARAGAKNGTPLAGSGIIQAREVSVASQYGGRIADLVVEGGQVVGANDVLVRLDTALLDAQIRAAQAGVSMAEAALAQAQAGARPGQITIAQAQLAQAQASSLAAAQVVSDTRLLIQNPQDIELQIAVTQAQIQSSDHQLAEALALKDAAQIGKDQFQEAMQKIQDLGGLGKHRIKVKVWEGSVDQLQERIPPELWPLLPQPLVDGVYTLGDFELQVHGGTCTLYRWVTVDLSLPLEAHLAPNAWWQSWVGVNTAAAQKEGLQASLGQLVAQRDDPQDLRARGDEAAATLGQARAQVSAAEAQVQALQAGATKEQIAALQARVDQARATLGSLLSQRAMMQVRAPIDGVAVDIAVHRGEVAAPGATLVTVADLAEVHLTVYVPEDQVGRAHLGQKALVTVDSFPGRVFEGQVTYIADRAEFTPRNVSTKEERVNLVFGVEIRLSNTDQALKPGMPADATFEE